MAKRHFKLVARVNTNSPYKIEPILEELFAKGRVESTNDPNEFLVEAEMAGDSAKELNRSVLSTLRSVEKKTRIRAEWTSGDTTERFFDYVLKSTKARD
jgi:hypothetical protein